MQQLNRHAEGQEGACTQVSHDVPGLDWRRKVNKLWLIEVFVRVAECGSFSRAAESLDLANGTVTNCVHQLERHLGITLFNRDTRRVYLTEEGQLYLRYGRSVLESLAEAEETVRMQASALSGSLHLEMPISVGRALVCPALMRFAQKYPGLSVAVTLTNQPRHVIEGRIDLAIRMHHVEDADLVARKICDSRYVVCCTPEVARTLPPHPSDLNPAQCVGILVEEHTRARAWVLETQGERLEIQPRWPLRFNSTEPILQLFEDFVGPEGPVACVLGIFVRRQLAEGTLVQVYPEWTRRTRPVYLVFPKARVKSAKVRALADFITELFISDQHGTGHRAIAVKPMKTR